MRTAGLGLLVAIVVAAHPGAQQLAPQPRPSAALDYETFKTRVQPILMAARKGNARCLSCHSRGGGNTYLEPLAPAATSYTEEQTRRNFERVQKLVVPGEPLKSILLTNPLDESAGGSHWHGGGKHWRSQSDPEWQTLASWVKGGLSPAGAAGAGRALDFNVYRSKVEPIRAVPVVSRAWRRELVPRTAPGRCRHVLGGAVAPQLRARLEAGDARRSVEEHPADESPGRRGWRQPLARRREALAVAEQHRVADPGGVGTWCCVVDPFSRRSPPAASPL